MHKCLECLDVSLASMLDTHPLLLFYLYFLYTVAAIRHWSPGERVPRRCLLRRGDPRRLGVVRRFPGRRPHLFDRVVMFVLAFLRHILYFCVCTQILLLQLTLCSWAVVFEPSWRLACNMKLELFLFIELCCDIPTVTPWSRSCILRVWLVHDRKSGASQNVFASLMLERQTPPNHIYSTSHMSSVEPVSHKVGRGRFIRTLPQC